MPDAPIPSKRLFSLDVVRGLAIALVLFRHLPDSGIVLGGAGDALVQWLQEIGWIGVDLFFVLSGFLISGLIYAEFDRSGGFQPRRFWLRRGFKIWPAYFAAYGGMTVLRVVWEGWRGHADQAGALVRSAACNAVFLQNYLPCQRWSHSWSLAVEEHFYTVFALVAGVGAAIAARRGIAGKQLFLAVLPLFALVAIAALWLRWQLAFPVYVAHGDISYYRSHLRADSLLFGVLLGYVMRYRRSWLPQPWFRWPMVVVALSTAALWPTLWPVGRSPYAESLGFTLIYLAFGVVVVAAAWRPDFGTAAHAGSWFWRGLAWLGVYSYTIYLAHAVLFGIPGVDTAHRALLRFLVDRAGEPIAVCGDRFAYLALSLLGGWLLSHLVERPFLRLRERIWPMRSGARA